MQDALEKLMKGRTTMVIAHRLSTIKDSSKIVAFDKGKVFEEGTHDDLLKTDGSLYRKLWDRQLSKRGGEEEDERETEEEKEEFMPLPVEAGMNPKPDGLRRLEALMRDMDDSDPIKKEIQNACVMLEAEKKGREVRSRGIQRGTIRKWQHHAKNDTKASPGTKNFKRLANKVIFNKMHSEVTERLQSIKDE